jgi:hypothetical protein
MIVITGHALVAAGVRKVEDNDLTFKVMVIQIGSIEQKQSLQDSHSADYGRTHVDGN